MLGLMQHGIIVGVHGYIGVHIAIAGVQAGEYLVRIQVDGAESLLTVDTDESSPTYGDYVGPVVTVP